MYKKTKMEITKNILDVYIFLFVNCRKVTVTDYQGICSPQESHQSSASRTFSESVAKTIAILGNFLWSMAFGFNFQNLWQVAFAFAGESVRPLDGKK